MSIKGQKNKIMKTENGCVVVMWLNYPIPQGLEKRGTERPQDERSDNNTQNTKGDTIMNEKHHNNTQNTKVAESMKCLDECIIAAQKNIRLAIAHAMDCELDADINGYIADARRAISDLVDMVKIRKIRRAM